MKSHARKCYNQLKKLGCPVKEWHDDSRGHFWLSAEEENSSEWLDYWSTDKCGGSEQLNHILSSHGLYFEWENSAVGHVHDA